MIEFVSEQADIITTQKSLTVENKTNAENNTGDTKQPTDEGM